MISALLDFIAACPTAFHTVENVGRRLTERGFVALAENEAWEIRPGGQYFVTRNGSSLIAFRVPEGPVSGFMPAAVHGDSPALRIKENAEMTDAHYVRFSTERYGGMLCAPWMDKPLSVAGRVCVRTGAGMDVRCVDLKKPMAIIPSVAIHMNRAANDNAHFDFAVDMLPLAGTAAHAGDLCKELAAALGVEPGDILSHDLYLYDPQPGVCFGDLVCAPRLDDLEGVFGCLQGFLAARVGSAMPLFCLFDNEEVGSSTKQGADSPMLADLLDRVCLALGLGDDARARLLADSLMVSCDNAHAVHPNHPEWADRNHTSTIGGGVVIKYNASQKYTTDGVSAGLFKLICDEAGAPWQTYANRADLPGGSTLGNISNSHVALNTLDVGLAQLAMHSSYETAGTADLRALVDAMTCFFGTAVRMRPDGSYDVTFPRK